MAASTSIAVVVFIFGALLLLIALIGGGFILKELSAAVWKFVGGQELAGGKCSCQALGLAR